MKLFCTILALCACTTATMLAQTAGVSVDLVLDQDQFLPDEDMIVGVRVSNRSGRTLELGKEADWLTFSILGENNFIVEKLGTVPVIGEFSLRSGQAGTPRFNLTPYFNFRRLGRYRVTATVKIPEWNREITSPSKTFTVMNGVQLANVPPIEFGVPPPAGETNAAPEVRRYVLQKATYLKQLTLYFRLTDASGSKTLRVFPLGPVVSFAQPEAQIDRGSNLHLLYQFGARTFNYCVINPDGKLLVRRVYEYAEDSRPMLRNDNDGKIFVGGGLLHPTATDIPAWKPAPVAPSSTNAPQP